MKRLTCLSPFVPSQTIPHAGGQFLFHYLTEMAAHAEVRLVAPDMEMNRAVGAQGPRNVEIHLVPLPALSTNLVARAVRYARTSANGLTVGVGEKKAFARDRTARALVADSDLVEIQWSELLQLVPVVRRWNPSVPIVSVELDVRYQSIQGRARHATRLRDRTMAKLATLHVRRREPALLNLCDAVLTFTDKDVRILRELGVTVPVHVLAPYLTMPEDWVGPSSDPHVLFVGAFDRPENSEGAMWLLDRVWPSVRRRCPGAVLTLAGAHPPDALLARAAVDVRVTGFVDDLDPLYRSSRLVVCPLLAGGGLKFKVPQAMAYGIPVVATTVAADGIVERSGPSVFARITDEPDEIADAILALLEDRSLAIDVGGRGRAWARDAYRFEQSVQDVLALYNRLA